MLLPDDLETQDRLKAHLLGFSEGSRKAFQGTLASWSSSIG